MADEQEHSIQTNKTSFKDIASALFGLLFLVGVAVNTFKWISSDSPETDNDSTVISESTAISNAEQIIQNNMRSPDSYQRRSATVIWKGSTPEGKAAFGVKVDYNGQNGFGATIRNCEYIFYFRDGENIEWHEDYGREPCDAVQYFTNEAELATTMGKKLGELTENQPEPEPIALQPKKLTAADYANQLQMKWSHSGACFDLLATMLRFSNTGEPEEVQIRRIDAIYNKAYDMGCIYD